jgi:carbon-monoxide dehydrogenase small subunit
MISLDINGRKVKAEIEPRLNLADFLREHQFLTGTHVGCEHGVCGACTVLLDGAPARSCITYAVACDGAIITTIEGLERDPVMAELREAFSEHHALQCGYCTPGMLMTARDIVLRLPSPDERRIRLELSGNLCRCTGYAGIVSAVQSVLSQQSGPAVGAARSKLGPVGSHPPAMPQSFSQQDFSKREFSQPPKVTAPAAALDGLATDWAAVEREGVELKQSFSVPFERAAVWRFFSDLDRVARCMPGARLTKPPQDGRAEGEVSVKLGPIVSAFRGVLDVARDDNAFRGVVRGAGRDAKSPSSARAIIAYEVHALETAASRVDVSVKFLLSGPLAQFSRSGLVRDVADHLTRVFAGNLEANLAGKPAPAASAEVLDAAAIARSAFFARLRAFFRKLIGS